MNDSRNMNQQITEEVLAFFFPHDQKQPYSRDAQELAVLVLGEALHAAKMLDYAFLPPTSMPRIGWLLTTAAKEAWAALKHQYGSVSKMPAIVQQRIESLYRSIYLMLSAGDGSISDFLNQPRPY